MAVNTRWLCAVSYCFLIRMLASSAAVNEDYKYRDF